MRVALLCTQPRRVWIQLRVDLSGSAHVKTVVITGIAEGLGRTTARSFERAGARIFGCDVDEDGLEALRREMPTAQLMTADVSDPAAVDAFFAVVSNDAPAVDVLVNNVGIAGPRAPVEEISLEQWQESLQTNLTGAFLTLRHVLPGMKARRHGAIINISTGSVRTLPPCRSPYVVSKGALESLTRAVAREVGPFGIRCNAVQPGMMDNARLTRVLARVAEQSGKTLEAVEAEQLQFVSTRSKVSMEEVAEMVVFLASDAARNITGQIIAVDGGIEWEA